MHHYVQERADQFLALFPHRFDYIWAAHPDLDQPTEWRTESRHPLSDRQIRQGSYLYGVRFGSETNYCLLDIDVGSAYHPRQDPIAIPRLLAALEAIGLVSYLACTSSSSQGLHLYFPFQQAQSSWQLAIVLATLLENAGYKLKPGQLEIFPDPKPYSVSGQVSLFNAHRLPMQAGSYLLNPDWQPIWSHQQTWVQQWQFAQTRNEVDAAVLKRIVRQAKRKRYQVSGKADKFLNDLNAEIELGWTGAGQTNRLLGRITLRAYVFHHLLVGGVPLEGGALVQEIVETARSLPGYFDYCRHQHEIEQRATEWAACIERSHYFHYGDGGGKFKPIHNPVLEAAVEQTPTWNQQQSSATRDRIKAAIADLWEQECLPAGATARFRVLLTYGLGGGSLYRHRDLWHPQQLREASLANSSLANASLSASSPQTSSSGDNPPHPPAALEGLPDEAGVVAVNGQSPSSLFPSNGGNLPPALELSADAGSVFSAAAVRATGVQSCLPDRATGEPQTWLSVSQVAHQIARSQQQRREAAQAKQMARMQQFLDSGDPILMAEALAWAAVNPGGLQAKQAGNRSLTPPG